MAYDYTAELQRLYDEKLASFRPAQAAGSVPDLTTSLPRGMSDIEIAQAEIANGSGYPRDTSDHDWSGIDRSNIDRSR